ncbi:hypothetical protein LAZ67_23001458 [Cordylochernes scorpioides]|uniref:Transposase n=1 Tax=Cordylochernes scorpioides TaxID=51811 RepID=A0ABY6LQP6_9ARAC|nr:hypothetical protein LAZ67_23001458 [Cordylochernes scorpioides]
MFNSDPYWPKIVITGDETWVYGYDPETKRQLNQRLLREALRQKIPEKWYHKNWLLHHDNARPHTATVQLYLAKHRIALLPQPPYSPELAPNDFFLNPNIKKVYKNIDSTQYPK